MLVSVAPRLAHALDHINLPPPVYDKWLRHPLITASHNVVLASLHVENLLKIKHPLLPTTWSSRLKQIRFQIKYHRLMVLFLLYRDELYFHQQDIYTSHLQLTQPYPIHHRKVAPHLMVLPIK